MTTIETIHTVFKTTNPTMCYTFKWEIENFIQVVDGFVLKSTKFRPLLNTTWYATLQKKSQTQIIYYLTGIILGFNCSSSINVDLTLEVKILDNSGNFYSDCELYLLKETNVIREYLVRFPTDNCGSKTFNDLDYLPHGKCVLMCSMKFDNYDIKTEASNCGIQSSPSMSLNVLGSELMNIYRGGNFSDVTLKAQECTLFAHKVILSARSEVFMKTFQTQIVEQATDIIEITDIEPQILKLLLEYIYSDVCPQIEFDSAQALYCAANKYCVSKLKQVIIDFMLSHIATHNAVEMLFFAQLFDEKKLKQKVVSFIKAHKDESGILESFHKFTGDNYKTSYIEVLRLLL